MHVKRSRPSLFDTRSLTLFATLAVTGSMATAQAVFGPSAPANPVANTARAPATTAAQIPQSFRQADADGNGSISRQEAGLWPGLAGNFDKADANRDGALSRSEYEKSTR